MPNRSDSDLKRQYPPTAIHTADGNINILQLTDPHLYWDTTTSTAGINNHQNFVACLNQALNEDRRCDLILLTGDLVNEVNTQIYDRIFELLQQTGIPHACIAGNHDVTDELNTHLAFEQRQFVAHTADPRLLSRHSIQLNNWELLLLDSSVPGKIYGAVGNKNLQWLRQKLANCHNPVMIAMHHHLLPMHSAWIDAHITQDASDFWALIKQFPQVKAVLSGHVHQDYESSQSGVNVYTTPSTCYQFKPNEDDFALDPDASPGYRWLTLTIEGEINSWVTRLTKPTN
ncbi:metallophosphoesterase [Psychrobacter sp. FDAARGOS_221]|uniref:metallophosphoesterase n=1 Tax=Psychrobacter sp. FDAARGOS_221 TaxID=1975705 RepID=UPI000BB58C86|nr:metallophosphoesterase [Psychrobacter sp. FDAARGOS_221]PNK60553.1 3',5'-cyclic-nucleotide phosphodiesterase [Psychrobacter sp. FDAARGOS_221]